MILSPNGRWLVAWGESIGNGFTLWDLSNANLETLDLAALNPLVVPAAHNSVITRFAFSPDGTILASAGQDGTAKLWRLSSEKPQLLMVLSGHAQGLNDVTFSPDSNQLATASQDGTVRLWDITPGGTSEWFTFAGHTDDVLHIALTQDGKYLATASADGSAKLWDLASMREILAITEHGSPLYSVAISPDGTLLATAGYDNIAKLWKLELSPRVVTAKLLHTLSGHGDGRSIGDEAFPGLTSVEFSPDSTKLATGGVGGLAKIWDVSTGQELLSIQIHPDRFGITSLAFSPDGRYLATASDNTGLKFQDIFANIWDATSGKELSAISDQRSLDYVWDLTFSPDGRRVATGSRNGSLRIWNAKTGEELLNLPGHGEKIFGVNFSRDGKYLVTASTDGTVKVWDAHSGKGLRVYSSQNSQFFDATFTPDGKYVIASSDGIVYGFVFDTQELIRLAESRLTRWFYLDECRQYLHLEECPVQ